MTAVHNLLPAKKRRRTIITSSALLFFQLMTLDRSASGATLIATILSSVISPNASAESANVALSFDGALPRFAIVDNNSNHPSLILSATQSRTVSHFRIGGIVRDLETVVNGSNLQLRFSLTSSSVLAASIVANQIVCFVRRNEAVPDLPKSLERSPGVTVSGKATDAAFLVVPLKFADVSEVVGLLFAGQPIAPNDTFVPQASNLGSPSSLANGLSGIPTAQAGSPGTVFKPSAQSFGSGQQAFAQRINENLAVDRRLNAVILSGSPSEIARLNALISAIDIPLQSVLLETQVVELTDTAAKNVGLDFSLTNGQLVAAQYQLKNLTSGQGAINLQAAIYDQVARGGGRIVARPRILAQSGSSASILTGDALPIVTSITFAGSSPVVQQQVQYVNVGVNLQIQPRISSDGFVTTHIFSEVSSVTGYIQGYPQISQHVATTAATVRDGEAFVIGGLVQENELSNLSKVPGIGDVPVIGGLFRVRHDTRQRTNLYIVVTPRIVGGPATGVVPDTAPGNQ